MNPSSNKISCIIAGAGAIENAWKPILTALRDQHRCELTPDGANLFLARMVYLLRWWALSPGDFAKSQFEAHMAYVSELKERIASEIRNSQANGEIRHRDTLRPLFEKFIEPYSPAFGLISTNWDSVIPDAIKEVLDSDFDLQVHPLHVHGTAEKAATMYLPSEVTKEPYRTTAEDYEIGVNHSTMIAKLENVGRVILYGLSVDPLDAELAQTLAAGWSNPNLTEIFIVDPQHKIVGHRVNLLLDPRRTVKVWGVNAKSLDIESEYTI